MMCLSRFERGGKRAIHLSLSPRRKASILLHGELCRGHELDRQTASRLDFMRLFSYVRDQVERLRKIYDILRATSCSLQLRVFCVSRLQVERGTRKANRSFPSPVLGV